MYGNLDPESGEFLLLDPESSALEYGIQLKESRIQNSSSTDID